jgi:hypothetical protein
MTVDVVRLDAFTPGMTAKALLHRRQIVETTPGLRLVDPETGELRANPVHWLEVPSHSDPARVPWEIRVSWHPNSVAAWHHGEACPAYENLGRCWHLLAAVLRIATAYHQGEVPEPAPAPAPPERAPEPARPRPVDYAVGFFGD